MSKLHEIFCLLLLGDSLVFSKETVTRGHVENKIDLKLDVKTTVESLTKNVKVTKALKRYDKLIELGSEKKLFDVIYSSQSTSTNESFSELQDILDNFS